MQTLRPSTAVGCVRMWSRFGSFPEGWMYAGLELLDYKCTANATLSFDPGSRLYQYICKHYYYSFTGKDSGISYVLFLKYFKSYRYVCWKSAFEAGFILIFRSCYQGYPHKLYVLFQLIWCYIGHNGDGVWWWLELGTVTQRHYIISIHPISCGFYHTVYPDVYFRSQAHPVRWKMP